MTNTNKLKGRIVEKGFNISRISVEANMSRPSFRSKLVGERDFRVSEIERLCEILDIPKSEIETYFFAADVPALSTVKH